MTSEDLRAIINGWCSKDKLYATLMHLKEFKSKRGTIVEIGTYNGSWLLPVALETKLKCIGIDPYSAGSAIEGMTTKENIDWWNNQSILDNTYKEVIGTIGKYNLTNISLIRKTSEEYISEIKDNSILMFHSDANHSFEPTMRNVKLYLPKVKVGGIFIQDDVGWTESGEETVRPAINWLLNNGCEFIEEVSGAYFMRKTK